MKNILENIKGLANQNKKLLAVLIDPDKMDLKLLSQFIDKVNKSDISHIFVGGSTVEVVMTQNLVSALKPLTNLPVVLFPGEVSQISNDADALLFLSLLSGRNPDYLIGKHVEAVSVLKNSKLQIIPTGYILIDGGNETAVQRVTRTEPLRDLAHIVDTAKAGELLGMQLIYLEAGSGAKRPVSRLVVEAVKKIVDCPVIVGGGIRSKKAILEAYAAGADMVVIGTAFEEDETFFKELNQLF